MALYMKTGFKLANAFCKQIQIVFFNLSVMAKYKSLSYAPEPGGSSNLYLRNIIVLQIRI